LLIKEGSLTLSVGKDNFKNDIFTANILTIPKQKAHSRDKKPTNPKSNTRKRNQPQRFTCCFISGEIEFYEPLEPIQPPPTKFEFFKQSRDHKIKLNMTTTEFLKSLNLQDKIIKSAKLTLKKITLEGNNQTQTPSPPAGEGKGEGTETQFILIELQPKRKHPLCSQTTRNNQRRSNDRL
jgi:hypothetical protein